MVLKEEEARPSGHNYPAMSEGIPERRFVSHPIDGRPLPIGPSSGISFWREGKAEALALAGGRVCLPKRVFTQL